MRSWIRGNGGGMGLLACGSRHRAADVQEVSELAGNASTNDNITVDAVSELRDPPPGMMPHCATSGMNRG